MESPYADRGMAVVGLFHALQVVLIMSIYNVDICNCGHPWHGITCMALLTTSTIFGQELHSQLLFAAVGGDYLTTF